mmetsp:Transcript_922/g.1480  ORF Transcript_922/g.1480 Transcript_922/m.1480 type:complete len:398 (-) Transcript_922:87-1280(-)
MSSIYEALQREYPVVTSGNWDAIHGINFLEEMDKMEFGGSFNNYYKYQDAHTTSCIASSKPSTIPSQSCPSYFTDGPYPYPPTQTYEDAHHMYYEGSEVYFPMNASIPGRRSAPANLQPALNTHLPFSIKNEEPIYEEREIETQINDIRSDSPSIVSPKEYSYEEEDDDEFVQSEPLSESAYSTIINGASNGFTQRYTCYYSENGSVPIDCDLCSEPSCLEVNKVKNAKMSCGHYVVCNECRGRTVRRLLRCPDCSLEMTGSFPVCKEGACIDVLTDKEPSNTGTCPRCDKKLRKEICGATCGRRKSKEYLQVRKKLNGMVAVLVLNSKDCSQYSESGVWRPCSHYSYCTTHKAICKGHGKDTNCSKCKQQKKDLKRRASLGMFASPAYKRRCYSHI